MMELMAEHWLGDEDGKERERPVFRLWIHVEAYKLERARLSPEKRTCHNKAGVSICIAAHQPGCEGGPVVRKLRYVSVCKCLNLI